MARTYSEQEFSQHLNTTFHLELSDGRVADLKLAEVNSYTKDAEHSRPMERYSLFFDGPTATRLNQGTYRLKHDQMGELDIFLVPVESTANHVRYEAVFNFFKEPASDQPGGDKANVASK